MSDREKTKESVSVEKTESTRPVLKLIYDAEKEIPKQESKPVRQPSRLVQFMNAYADSVEKDVRHILEF